MAREPVNNVTIRPKSKTDPAGNEDGYLYRSRSLSHWVGSAEGTRPQPMQTDQNHVAASYNISERHWNTEFDPRRVSKA